jgi:hypothetical protein
MLETMMRLVEAVGGALVAGGGAWSLVECKEGFMALG